MESGDRLMCWMYLRSSGSICTTTEWISKCAASHCFSVVALQVLVLCARQPCRWAARWGAWLLSAGPGPCWTAARWAPCKPAPSPPRRTTPPWPAPRLASPGRAAGDPGRRARAPCCSGRRRASRKARRSRRGETEGGGGETEKEKKQGYREVEGRGASVNDWRRQEATDFFLCRV